MTDGPDEPRGAGRIAQVRALARKLLRPHREYAAFGMRVAYTGLALAVSILLARLLGPAPLGQYYEFVAWALLIGTVVQSGWANFLVREVAALRETRRYAELRGLIRVAIAIVAGLSLAGTCLFLAVTWLTARSEVFELFLVGSPIILLLSTSSLRQAITRGMGRPLWGLLCENITRPGVQLIGLCLFASGVVALPFTPLVAVAVFVVAISSSAVLAYFLQKASTRQIRGNEPPRLPPRSEWLPAFLRTAVLGWAHALGLQIGTLVLSGFSSDVEIAYFRIGQQLSLLLAFGLTVATSLYAQDFSRHFVRGDLQAVQRLASKAALISGATAIAVGMIFLVGGEALIGRLYGAEFAPAYAPMAIMAVGQIVNNLYGPMTAVCLGTRSEKAAMRAQLLSVLLSAMLSFALVPLWGAEGAAVATALGFVFWNTYLFIFLKRRLNLTIFAGSLFLVRRRGDS